MTRRGTVAAGGAAKKSNCPQYQIAPVLNSCENSFRKRGIPGKKLAKALDRARIVCNFNSVPGDTAPPANPSGIRLGTPAVTTRGMREEQMDDIARFVKTVTENIDKESVIESVGREVLLLCSAFPVPDHFMIPQRKQAPFSSER